MPVNGIGCGDRAGQPGGDPGVLTTFYCIRYRCCHCLLKITNALSLYLLLFIAILARVTGEQLRLWSTRVL